MPITINKIWIDESGDSGFKFKAGSSKYLVLTLVYLLDENEIDIGRQIDQLKKKLSVSSDYEFKFSRSKNKFREDFLKLTRSFSIEYKAVILNKKSLNIPDLKSHPHFLYSEMVRRLLYDNDPPLKEVVLILDEAVAKIHRREFNTMLRKSISKKLVRKIRQKRSKNNTMIQIADMICESIFRKFERREKNYYQIIKSKERILIEF